MYDEFTVANSFLRRSFEEKRFVTPMKLQKLLYFLYRDYLQKTGQPLFSERFACWKYGPVLDSVYHRFKRFGSNPIDEYATRQGQSFAVDENADPVFASLISRVWEQGKQFTGIQLARMTHNPEGAWNKAYQSDRMLLSDTDIKNDHTPIAEV